MKMEVTPEQAILHCKKAEKSDTGKYTLTLSNDKGQDSTMVNVIVFGKLSAICLILFSLFFLFREGGGTKTMLD